MSTNKKCVRNADGNIFYTQNAMLPFLEAVSDCPKLGADMALTSSLNPESSSSSSSSWDFEVVTRKLCLKGDIRRSRGTAWSIDSEAVALLNNTILRSLHNKRHSHTLRQTRTRECGACIAASRGLTEKRERERGSVCYRGAQYMMRVAYDATNIPTRISRTFFNLFYI